MAESMVVDHLHAPGHLLRRAQQVHTEAWSRLVCEDSGETGSHSGARLEVSDVTGPQYAVLVAVDGWTGLDQKRAGELASLDKSTAAAIVTRLVAGGWLRRVHDPDDGRRWLLELSAEGKGCLPMLTRAARAVQEELLAPLAGQGRDEFLAALAAVARIDESDIREQQSGDRALRMARTPGYLIRRAQQLHTAYWTEHVRDLTGPQYAVLAAVLTAGVATHVEIGVRASLDSSSTRDIVGRLIEKGWLESVANTRDRRSRPVRVSSPAVTAVRLLREPVQDVQRHVLEPLDPSARDQFIAWMRRIARVESPSEDDQRHSTTGLTLGTSLRDVAPAAAAIADRDT